MQIMIKEDQLKIIIFQILIRVKINSKITKIITKFNLLNSPNKVLTVLMY